MRKLRNMAAALIGSVLLAACWSSSTPLITKADADMPDVSGEWVSAGGKHYDLTADKTTRSFAAETWTETNPTAVSETLSFEALNKGWYVVQSVNSNGLRGYEIARIEKDRISVWSPGCGTAVHENSDVEIDVNGDCIFNSLKGLRAGAEDEIARLMSASITPYAQYERQ